MEYRLQIQERSFGLCPQDDNVEFYSNGFIIFLRMRQEKDSG